MRDGATRHVTRSLPDFSELLARDHRLGAGSRSPRAACVRARGRRCSEPVAMKGVHPFTLLAKPPTLDGGLGPARGCERRASRASAPCDAAFAAPVARATFTTTRPRPPVRAIARSHDLLIARATRRSGVIESRVRISMVRRPIAREEPRLALSRTPVVTHRRRTSSEPDVRHDRRAACDMRAVSMGRRPSRSTERRRPACEGGAAFDGLGDPPREGRVPGGDRGAFGSSGMGRRAGIAPRGPSPPASARALDEARDHEAEDRRLWYSRDRLALL